MYESTRVQKKEGWCSRYEGVKGGKVGVKGGKVG